MRLGTWRRRAGGGAPPPPGVGRRSPGRRLPPPPARQPWAGLAGRSAPVPTPSRPPPRRPRAAASPLSVPGSPPLPPPTPPRRVPRVPRRSPSPLGGEGPGSAGAGGRPVAGRGEGPGRGREGGRGPGGDVWWRVRGGLGAGRRPAGVTPSRARQRRGCRLPRAGVEAGAAGRVPRRSTARLSSVFLQVPSAFRRGGLKTPVGSPVRLGSGADGPAGEPGRPALLPARSPSPPRGAAVAFAPRAPGGGAGTGASPARRPSSGLGRVPRPLRVFRGGRKPLGACGVPGRAPEVGGARAHPVFYPPDPSQSGVVVCRRPAGGHPLRGENVPCRPQKKPKLVRLLAVDHSARASMKNAASCEN